MENLKKTLKTLPHEPGVYIYRNLLREIIYVGKAKDLFNRVHQYFQKRGNAGDKTERLVSEIDSLEIIPTTSEFDALLLEAKLIRSNLPKYNVISRDDKSPLYAVITYSEALPRLLLIRKGEIPFYEKHKRNRIYGPFQSGYALRMLLRQLRSIVPYCIQKERTGKPCFYTHLGLCDPCPSAIVALDETNKRVASRRYRHAMYRLSALFEGRIRWLSKEYEKEMREAARLRLFEQAAKWKVRLAVLHGLSQHRYDPQVFIDQGADDIYEEEIAELAEKLRLYYPRLTQLDRIECFDISNLFGAQAVASMVVLVRGRPEKKEYRRFRIRTVRTISDVAMMREVLIRRLAHTEWPYPDFLLVDGGKTQAGVAREVLASSKLSIPTAGLAKREEEIIIPNKESFTVLRLPLSGRAIKVVMRIRDEAHRFAISYHRLLRSKAFLGK